MEGRKVISHRQEDRGVDLESLGLAEGTINQRLAAVKHPAYEAADSGLLSPESWRLESEESKA